MQIIIRRNFVAGGFLPRIADKRPLNRVAIDQSTVYPVKMVFILGVNFPERNLLKASNTYTHIGEPQHDPKSLESFFGIGNHTSSRLLARFNIHPTCRVGELANKQVLDMTAVLSDMKIENDLRREVLNDIKRLKETGTYRGRRHALGLPVRGQRTRTQIKTPVKLNRMERRL
ncbi:hypothetical protein PENSTE_c004G01862 [Penicillium steckii]|uniref:Ribosomal protein S13 n=1 Tax=Penicillium steckii TaxID=303698 RepID=A0A1V6TMZ7_9EURO|nr:hypothetical protein PENSTE_c004G01862 [Penicillium steckii]